VLRFTAIFASGLFAWTFLEYVIHGWLSHVFTTFATPLHAAHHKDPRAVFTVGAWLPILATWVVGALLIGWSPAMVFFSGAVCGFIGYEIFHYRIHFVRPVNNFEAGLRARHLIHHFHRPDATFGVTSALWDRVFSSELPEAEVTALTPLVASIPPIEGPSNANKILRLGRWW
jgi:sterol desaturase/sphingolipid hydroxylase (fatty acid hydroxylase superfamily)